MSGPGRLPMLSKGETAVWLTLQRAAAGGKVCPTNEELADICGYDSPAMATLIVKRLENFGLISVDRQASTRTVAILFGPERGKTTAAPQRAAPAKRAPAHVKGERDTSRNPLMPVVRPPLAVAPGASRLGRGGQEMLIGTEVWAKLMAEAQASGQPVAKVFDEALTCGVRGLAEERFEAERPDDE